MEMFLKRFHDEYVDSIEKYVSPEFRQRLVRYSLLPTPITGYVSTQLGAGYEYGVGDTEISIRRGSRRVEELFVSAPDWLSRLGPFFNVGGANMGIARMTLDG